MAIPTALIGCLPTYDQVGLLAPVVLILLRSLQGFAIGGEFTGTMVFLVEHAPAAKRGFWGSFASFSAVMGVILGSLLVATLNSLLSIEAMHSWGWRLPFMLSVLGSVVGVYMRSRLIDPELFLRVKERGGSECLPLRQLLRHYKSNIGCIMLLDFLNTIGFFIVAIFLVTYFKTHLNIPTNIALVINTFNMCLLAASILIGGMLSDYIGCKPVLVFSCIGFIIFSYPLFLILQTDNYFIIASVQAVFSILMGLFFGVIPVTLAGIMPTIVRCSGVSIAHSLSVAIFGGGAPFMATHLIHYTGNLAAPAYLLISASFLSLSSLFFIKDRSYLSLKETIEPARKEDIPSEILGVNMKG
jgi:MHS family proline/betaine transporter-like MFS transporter